MNELLERFKEIIAALANNIMYENVEKGFIEAYNSVSEEEKKELFNIVANLVDEDKVSHMIILSYILKVVYEDIVGDEIKKTLIQYDYTMQEYLAINFNLSYKKHILNESLDKDSYKRNIQIRKKYVDKLLNQLSVKFDYVPLNERENKRVLIMIEPILSEGHAPTNRSVNIYHTLKRMGYNPMIVSTSLMNICIQQAAMFYQVIVMEDLFEKNIKFKMNYFGEEVEGINFCYSNDNFINDISDAIKVVRYLNPEFIIEVGGNNILADACSEFTTVISRTCKSELPITNTRYIADFFEDEEILGKNLLPNQKLIKMPNINYFKTKEKDVERAEFGVGDDDFLIGIFGNRLGYEINDEVIELLNNITKKNDKIKILFVGKCDQLKNKNSYNEKFIFVGQVNSFENTIGICDILLNPKRIGGGSSAIAACRKGVPIVTLAEGDVAKYMGAHFICEDYEAMEKEIERYFTDKEYLESKKKKCLEIANEREQKLEDVMKELEEFCENVRKNVLEDEVK